MNLNTFKKFAIQHLPEAALLSLRKMHYERMLRKSSGLEEPELAVLRQIVFPGHYVLDIGANFGRYTYHLSRLAGPNGRVFSMEPIRGTFEVLRSNAHRLGLHNVSCLNQAVSEASGFVQMEVPEYETGWKNFYEARIVSRAGTIPCISLDDAFLNLPRLDFIKCDVEGHELHVLAGALNIIGKFRPSWMIEIGGDPHDSTSNGGKAFALLEQHGYEAHIAAHGQLQRWPGERATNYFFLPGKS